MDTVINISRRTLSAIIMAAGILLLWLGYEGPEALQLGISRFLGGSGSDHVVWMIIIGAAATIGGFVGLLRGESGI